MLVYKGPSLIRFALLEMLFDILRKINPDKNIFASNHRRNPLDIFSEIYQF